MPTAPTMASHARTQSGRSSAWAPLPAPGCRPESDWSVAVFVPGLDERASALVTGRVLAGRATVRRAIARSDIPPGMSVTVLMDALCGAIVNHALAAPPEPRADVEADAERYLSTVIDFLLAGALRPGD